MPVRTTKTDVLLKVIEGLGRDKNDRPIGIRTRALSEAAGVPTNSIQALLTPHIASGRLVVCKITAPGQITQNEYRVGPGVPPPDFTPLKAKRAGIALGQPGKPLPVTQPAPEWPALMRTPVFLSNKKPQPEVGNTGSRHAEASADTPPTGSADTAKPATPGPAPKRRGMGPASATASAGGVKKLHLAIDQDGNLQLGDDADPAQFVFPPEHVLQLGDFLHGTQGIWRP